MEHAQAALYHTQQPYVLMDGEQLCRLLQRLPRAVKRLLPLPGQAHVEVQQAEVEWISRGDQRLGRLLEVLQRLRRQTQFDEDTAKVGEQFAVHFRVLQPRGAQPLDRSLEDFLCLRKPAFAKRQKS